MTFNQQEFDARELEIVEILEQLEALGDRLARLTTYERTDAAYRWLRGRNKGKRVLGPTSNARWPR